ncbi:MAG: tol-pal system YbgF family protein [Pseudomonadales bacterium]
MSWAGLVDFDVFGTSDSDAKTVEIRFSQPLTVIEQLPAPQSEQIVLRLSPVNAKDYLDWSYSQLEFDESDHLVSSVTLEGSRAKDLSLTITFRKPVFAEVLPQYEMNHVLLTYGQPGATRGLAQAPKKANKLFALTLESRAKAVPELKDVPQSIAEDHLVYVVPFENAGQTWQRLRIGVFDTPGDAERVKALLSASYPESTVSEISEAESQFAQQFRLNPDIALRRAREPQALSESDNVTLNVRAVTPSSIDDEVVAGQTPKQWQKPEPVEPSRWAALVAEADDAFNAQDYSKAIRLYTKLSEQTDGPIAEHALERLGLSRELQRQIAQAKRVYEQYLNLYPEGEGADRVRQRLGALLAITEPAKPKLRAAKRRSMEPQWRVASNLSQYYRRHTLEINDNKTVALNGVFTDGNVNARRIGGDLEQELSLSISYLHDFTDRLGDRDLQFSSAYWDTYSGRLRTGLKVGRQTKYDAGVIGRFDGATLRHRLTDRLELGIVGGYLLDSSFDSPSTDRPFYGVYAEFSNASEALTISPYAVQQTIDGIVDRRAVGFQTQWIGGSTLVWTNVDYDIYHKALNNLMALANFGIGTKSSYSVAFDQRRSPYLTTRNALIGQPFEELTDLERELLDFELQELASDRTSTTRSVRANWNRELSDRWQFSTDIIFTDTSSTDTSANVTGFEPRQDVYYSMQLRAQDMFGEGTYSGVLARFSDSDTASTTSLYWNNRLNLAEKFWWYPRLRVDYRTFKDSDQTQQRYMPSLRVDYRQSNRVRFEFEVGYDYSTRETIRDDLEISGLFFSAGYRALF